MAPLQEAFSNLTTQFRVFVPMGHFRLDTIFSDFSPRWWYIRIETPIFVFSIPQMIIFDLKTQIMECSPQTGRDLPYCPNFRIAIQNLSFSALIPQFRDSRSQWDMLIKMPIFRDYGPK